MVFDRTNHSYILQRPYALLSWQGVLLCCPTICTPEYCTVPENKGGHEFCIRKVPRFAINSWPGFCFLHGILSCRPCPPFVLLVLGLSRISGWYAAAWLPRRRLAASAAVHLLLALLKSPSSAAPHESTNGRGNFGTEAEERREERREKRERADVEEVPAVCVETGPTKRQMQSFQRRLAVELPRLKHFSLLALPTTSAMLPYVVAMLLQWDTPERTFSRNGAYLHKILLALAIPPPM